MNPDGSPFQAQPVPDFSLNGTPVNNPYIPPGYVPPGQVPPGYTPFGNYPYSEPYSEANQKLEDEPSELQPQYERLPQSQEFLSAQAISKRYTEIQIGIGSASEGESCPPCDNYRSHRQIGLRPIVYACNDCVPPEPRYLCKKCAQKELADPEGWHKPDHTIRQWQPTWVFDVSRVGSIPTLTPEMEEFIRHNLPDDVRMLTFESRKYYDDRAMRIFLPAPPGRCHVVTELQIEPIENEKRPMDIVDKAKGFFNFEGLSEVFGNIGMSGNAFILSAPPIAPKKSVEKEPADPPKKQDFASSRNIDLKRGYNFRKLYTLDVYVDTKGNPEQNGIEIVLQDEYYPSKQFYHHPFNWTLKSIEVTRILPSPPSFASRAQMAQFQQRKADVDREDNEQRLQDMTEMYHSGQELYQNGQEYWEKYRGRRADRLQQQGQRPVSTPPPSSSKNKMYPSSTAHNSRTSRYRPSDYSPLHRQSPKRPSPLGGGSNNNSPQRGRARLASDGHARFDNHMPPSHSRDRLDPTDALRPGRTSHGTSVPPDFGRSGGRQSTSPNWRAGADDPRSSSGHSGRGGSSSDGRRRRASASPHAGGDFLGVPGDGRGRSGGSSGNNGNSSSSSKTGRSSSGKTGRKTGLGGSSGGGSKTRFGRSPGGRKR